MSPAPTGKKNAFGWTVAGAVTAVIIVMGAVFFNVLQEEQQTLNTAVPAMSAGMGQPIVLGNPDAENTITIWEDFQCPGCKNFESFFGKAIGDSVLKGTAKAEYYLASFLTEGSLLAANAAACSADQGKFEEYHQAIFIHQPNPQSGEQYTNELLLSLAETSQMPRFDEFEKCVTSLRYGTWLDSILDVMAEEGIEGTPEVIVNGERLAFEDTSEQQLAVLLGVLDAQAVTPAPTSPESTPAIPEDSTQS